MATQVNKKLLKDAVANAELSEEDMHIAGDLSEVNWTRKDMGIAAPVLDESMSTWIIIDNLPKVDSKKFPKLLAVLKKKVFQKLGKIADEDIIIPFDDAADKSKGYCFVGFNAPEAADRAVRTLQNYKFDSKHIFKVDKFDDFDRIVATPDEYTPPNKAEYEEVDNPRSWLLDDRGRDQFALHCGEVTQVHWMDPLVPPSRTQVVSKDYWTDAYVRWSPKGSYLASVHHQGIAVWGGPKWQQIQKFPHPSVQGFEFSPSEKFIVTGNNAKKTKGGGKVEAVIVWDVRSGRKLRSFEDGVLLWSFDDAFFARVQKDEIHVYDTTTMKLVDKKPLHVPGVEKVQWSPAANIMAFTVPEQADKPAGVTLMSFPEKKEVRSKNLFNVVSIDMKWAPDGKYFAVKVGRQKKKSKYTTLELFRIAEKDVPVETIDNREDDILAFEWEPTGHRFAILHKHADEQRPDVSLFEMKKAGGVKEILHLERKQCTKLTWSPTGKFLVMAGLSSGVGSGLLEFWNADDLQCMATKEHFMAQGLQWDPSGRYLASCVLFTSTQMENGFRIWTFHGQLVHDEQLPKLYDFIWRPRPPTLLSAKEIKKVKKSLNDLRKKFEEEDRVYADSHQTDLVEKRATMRKGWDMWREHRLQNQEHDPESVRDALGELADVLDKNDADVVTEVKEIDTLIETREEIVEG